MASAAFFAVLLLQTAFHPLKEVPLTGAEAIATVPNLTLNAWTERTFQEGIGNKLNLGFGFRPALVRLVNQLRFSLFTDHTPHIEVGKDGYYFESSYRASICGNDFIGTPAMEQKMDSLDAFRDALLRRGIPLVIMIAPNKWRTYSDKIEWDCEESVGNYHHLMPLLRRKGYVVCDMVDVFCYERELDTEFPLHSKQGTHWSVYGAAVSIDYLVMAFAEAGVALPGVIHGLPEVSDRLRFTDKDLHDLLNIMAPPKKERMAYPQPEFGQEAKPRVLVVGDSYYWNYYHLEAHEGLFAPESKFFYYNKTAVGNDLSVRRLLTPEMRQSELEAAEAVLLVMGEPSLARFGFGIFGALAE